ncbi:hypothetical protein [Actinomadura sp. GTD37]|uniref:hypothetical protein n=1 Tax=Actinomadura sp. GTD37 TaxID=1778030 RepID=UPI0035C173DA
MSRMQYDTLLDKVRHLNPENREVLDSPYTISNVDYHTLTSVVHDVGGETDWPQPYMPKGETEWEMNIYLTCECLGWRGAWNSEMRRRAENDLGKTQYYGLPYYGRWITVAAKTLVNKGLLTTDELGKKIDEVRERLESK